MISNTSRQRMAKFYLDAAERLPKMRSGTVSMLQLLREHQREGARKAVERSELPDGCNYEMLSVRAFDLIPIENMGTLSSELVALFPSLDDRLKARTFSEEITLQTASLLRTGWRNLGTIVRDPGKRLFAGNSARIKTLPDEVDYVHLGLHQIMPSLFVLALDIYVTKDATEEIKRILMREHLPVIQFKQLVPHGRSAMAHASWMAETTMQGEINMFLARVRDETLEAVPALFDGSYSKQMSYPIPHIEVFSFDGVPDQAQDLADWLQGSSGWWSALGFDFFGFDFFASPEYLLSISEYRGGFLQSPNRLVVRRQPLLSSLNVESYGDELSAINMNTRYALDSLQRGLAILEFLKLSELRVGGLRRIIFQELKPSTMSPFGLRKLIRLNSTLLSTVSSFDRLLLEFDQIKGHLNRDLDEVGGFVSVRMELKNTKELLKDLLPKELDFRLSVFDRHLELAKDSFSQHVQLMNLGAIYWLTVAALIIGVTAIVGWDNIISLVRVPFSALSELFEVAK